VNIEKLFNKLSISSGTNNLVDAIVVSGNPYTDTIAINVGYAIKSGTLIKKSGNYWLNGSNYVDKDLITRNSTNIVPIGTTSLTYWSSRDCSNGWNQSSATTGQYKPNDATPLNCSYSSGTGLYYDNGDSYRKTFTESNNLCLSKNMRLPNLNEINLNVSNGIPFITGFTWTQTIRTTGDYWIWNNTTISSDLQRTSINQRYTRCVK